MFTLFRFIKQLLLDLYSINHQFLTLPDSFQKALFSTNPALNVNLSWAEMVFYLDFYPYEKFVGIPALVRAYSCAFRENITNFSFRFVRISLIPVADSRFHMYTYFVIIFINCIYNLEWLKLIDILCYYIYLFWVMFITPPTHPGKYQNGQNYSCV